MRRRRSSLVAHTSPQVNEPGIMSVRRSLTESPSSLVLRSLPTESPISKQPMSLHALQEPYVSVSVAAV